MTNEESFLLLESMQDGVFMITKDGYFSYANQAACKMLGYSRPDVLDKNMSLIYGGYDEVLKAEYQLNQTAKLGIFRMEGWCIRKDGSRVWGDLKLTTMREGDTLIGYTLLLIDNTEQKKEELALLQSEERFRLMVDSVRDYAIFMLDPGGHIVTWNEGARRLKGYFPNEIIGKHFSTFYTQVDLDDKKPERELHIAVQTGRYEEEGWRVKKNGSLFWANIVITALFNNENQLVGFSKVTRDLTERKANEEDLKQSEERYRALVEQVLDYGIFMMDEKGRIISWNEGARRINGYTATDIIGKYFSIFYPEEDILNGKPARELKIAIAEGKYEEEGWRLRKNGTRFWASVVITAVYNSQRAHIGFSKVTRDLTERKESERALRESSDRFRMLAEELRITNTELSFANQELEQFTSIASHDLQEPVRTIRSYLQLMEQKIHQGSVDDLTTYTGKAIGAATRMRELIQNLLQYSQLSREDVILERVQIRDILNEALQNLKTSIDTANAEIHIYTEVETAWGDRVQLVQLIQNLLSNALKFIDDDHPKISIHCRREKGLVKFSVTDNGIGIAQSELGKIFDIFKRLHTKKEYPGTGIGLAICKKIVDRHGGAIWPESEPGKGTTFHFTINEEALRKLVP